MATKTCTKCGTELELNNTNFLLRKSGKRKGKYTSDCRQCQRDRSNRLYREDEGRRKYIYERYTEYRKKYPNRYSRATMMSIHRKRAVINSLKDKCSQCGFSDQRALHFHHIDPKTKSFTISSNCGASIKRLLEEIAKCIVLCANCHMILEYEKGKWNGDETQRQELL